MKSPGLEPPGPEPTGLEPTGLEPTFFSRRRVRIIVVALGVLFVAVIAALLAGPTGGRVALGVESVAAASATLLDRLALALPLGFAFGAGMVSAANPCGFALLPAYVGLVLGVGPGQRSRPLARFARAAQLSLAMTIGFVLVFGLVGGAIAFGARALVGVLPWLGLGIGVVLTFAGVWFGFGGAVNVSLGARLAPQLDRSSGMRGFTAFGIAFALASLSCTLPVFLAVLGSSILVPGLGNLALQLLAYSLGMASVVALATFLVAGFQGVAAGKLAALGRPMRVIGAVLLTVAGAYVTYYWLTIGGLAPAGLSG